MDIKNSLYFYRLLKWGKKQNNLRLFLYSALGYLMAGYFDFNFIFLNSLAVFGILAFCYSLNDYFDWKLQGDDNFLANKIKEKKLNEKTVLFLCFFPIIFCVPLFFLNVGYFPLALLAIFFVLTFFYSAPPVRFKERKIFDFFVPPIAAFILFLQGYFLLGQINLIFILFSVLVFTFPFYLELLHGLEHLSIKYETKRINKEIGFKLFKNFPVITLFLSIGFSFFAQVFLITSFFSLVRLAALRNFKTEDSARVRENIFLPQLSLYEFLIYGFLGAFHLI